MADEPVLVVVPTFNEVDNVERVVTRTRQAVPSAHVLLVDDGSPDGTGELADSLSVADSQVHVLHRAGKDGLGRAYLAGFAWALDRSYETIVQMDADGSHQPEQIPRLLAALGAADLVIGSRWVPGGTVVNWPTSRSLLSRGGNAYAAAALGIGLRDATGGFRAWRRSALEALGLADVDSQGYCFQVDLARRAVRARLRVVEVPIRFVERVEGQSKMSNHILREAVWRVSLWGAADRGRQLAALPGRLRRRGH